MRNIKIVTNVEGISEYSFPKFHDHYPPIGENIAAYNNEKTNALLLALELPRLFIVVAIIHTDVEILVVIEPAENQDFERFLWA